MWQKYIKEFFYLDLRSRNQRQALETAHTLQIKSIF